MARPLDLRQGGSRDEGQDEQDGRQGQAEAHGDGLGELVAAGLGLWSRRIGHYVDPVYTPPGCASRHTDSVVVGPPPRAREGGAGRQTTGRDLLAVLSRSTLAASSSIAEPSGNPTAHDEQEPRQEEGEHRES